MLTLYARSSMGESVLLQAQFDVLANNFVAKSIVHDLWNWYTRQRCSHIKGDRSLLASALLMNRMEFIQSLFFFLILFTQKEIVALKQRNCCYFLQTILTDQWSFKNRQNCRIWSSENQENHNSGFNRIHPTCGTVREALFLVGITSIGHGGVPI